MATIEPPIRYKPEDLLKMPDGDRYELVNGQLVEKEMGWEAEAAFGMLLTLVDLEQLHGGKHAASSSWVAKTKQLACLTRCSWAATDDPSAPSMV